MRRGAAVPAAGRRDACPTDTLGWDDRVVRELPELLRPGDLLVFNTTRVVPARFRGERVGTGGRMEGLFLREAATQQEPAGLRWVCLIRGRHTRAGAEFELFGRGGERSGIRLTVTGRAPEEPGAWAVTVEPTSPPIDRQGNPKNRVGGEAGGTTAQILEGIGSTPLPPYILKARRAAHEVDDEARDREDYQ